MPRIHRLPGHHGWTLAEAVALLESPDRILREDPKKVWKIAGLRPGEILVELGAGTGYYSASAAHQVGPEGRVYAVDHSKELVDHLARRRDSEQLPGLRPTLSTTETVPLRSGIADIVLLANVLHDLSPASVAEAVRLLAPQGRLIDVDWKRDGKPDGPPASIRLSPRQVQGMLRPFGLECVARAEMGTRHYLLRFERLPPERTSSVTRATSRRGLRRA